MNIKIEKLNILGEGVANLGGKKYVVRQVLPNEIVDVNEVKTRGNFVGCKLNKVVTQSEKRVAPVCPYQNKCGGCDLMFTDEETALELKKEVIKEYFAGIYDGEITCHASREVLGYRNKVSFFVDKTKIGLVEAESNTVTEVKSCLVAKKEINEVLNLARDYVKSNVDGNISHVVARKLDDGVQVSVVAKLVPKNIDLFNKKLAEKFGESYSLYVNINKNKKQILGDSWEFVGGKEMLTSTCLGITAKVHSGAFMQINDGVKEDMYNFVSNLVKGENVVEGYSGAGVLSCIIAKNAKSVTSVEINKFAHMSALETAKENDIQNVKFILGDCAKVLPKLNAKDVTFVVDPARAGVDNNTLDSIVKSKAEKVIYISCNPYTLKQNIWYLKEYYAVTDYHIFDIFPQTSNVESVVILKRR